MSSTAPPTKATTEAGRKSAPGAIRQWILQHDESWLFTLSYVGLAVVLSIWISLFWLVAVVGVHFALEWIRQSHLDPRSATVLPSVCWELKLDFALIVFALALAAYMEVILGMAGLGGAARLAQAGARTAGWSRAIRGVFLSMDDAAQVARAVANRRRDAAAKATPDTAALEPQSGRPRRWSFGDRIAVGLGAICLLLLLVAPWLTPHDLPSLVTTLAWEMHPWPADVNLNSAVE